jgi:hypothetical protein
MEKVCNAFTVDLTQPLRGAPSYFGGKWMGLEITLSEISQTQEDEHPIFSFICGS